MVVGNAVTLGAFYGTNTYPLTYKVLDVVSGLFSLFVLVVTAIYAGELVWRERDTRMEDITDSMPAPTWLGFLRQVRALFVLQAVLMGVVLGAASACSSCRATPISSCRMTCSTSSSSSPRGSLLFVALRSRSTRSSTTSTSDTSSSSSIFLLTSRMADFGLEDRLYRYASRPDVIYSDLNGYGHFLPAVFWFRLYWGAFAVLLLVLAYAMWVRGRDGGIRGRCRRQPRA